MNICVIALLLTLCEVEDNFIILGFFIEARIETALIGHSISVCLGTLLITKLDGLGMILLDNIGNRRGLFILQISECSVFFYNVQDGVAFTESPKFRCRAL